MLEGSLILMRYAQRISRPEIPAAGDSYALFARDAPVSFAKLCRIWSRTEMGSDAHIQQCIEDLV